ncbi:MAG TPA: CBS domain-containing protein [Nannocystaceae bacterium]|nr:CBS domain-containing protein [Nannocystaceae bacterium]
MKRNEPISHIMTKDPITVHHGQKVSEVRQLFIEHGIHHIPVVSGKRLLGIISATDMMRLSLSAYGSDERTMDAMLDHQFTIEQVMSKHLTTLEAKGTIREAAEKLREGRFHALPVVDEQGNLAGIVTTTDLIGYLLEQY